MRSLLELLLALGGLWPDNPTSNSAVVAVVAVAAVAAVLAAHSSSVAGD